MRGARKVNRYPVEVGPVVDPEGRVGVLLQMPDGFVILRPEAAREIAALLVDVAREVDG